MISPSFRAYAHRGGSREAPENSLTAFRHAVSLGFVHLETDVRPTRDGVALLHHDATLDRTTDGRGPVRERLWRDMAHIHHADGTAPLRLEDLLEALPDTHITVDAKEDASVLAIADAVRRTRSHDRICIASFSPVRLGRLRALLPGVESGAHPGEVLRLRAGLGSLPRASRVQVPLRALGVPLTTSSFMDRARASGLAVDVWTIDDPDEMARLIDIGVDGIMTDSPSILRHVLGNR